MYITRVAIKNIRSIKHLVWKINAGQAAGWHVILGDNGSGKSTFVRAVALPLIGVEGFYRFRQEGSDWLMNNQSKGTITTEFFRDTNYDIGLTGWHSLSARFDITRLAQNAQKAGVAGGFPEVLKDGTGWFAASYGPSRRFGRNDPSDQRILENDPRLARHLSNFDENVALTEGPVWLRDLYHKTLESDAKSQELYNNIMSFINQPNLLPNNTEMIDATSGGIIFQTSGGHLVPVELLSDGYRSVLSFCFELLRQLAITFDSDIFEISHDDTVLVKVPGVVLIDEVDSHLHPTWQKQIGFWLTKHFPNIQFIVTTHSPLVCQAAEKGSIFRLPTPGTEEAGRMLEGEDRDRLLYGDILDAYSTEAFGYGITRSERSHQMLDRLADLNLKEMMKGLSADERTEQDRLRAMLPTTASALSNGLRS